MKRECLALLVACAALLDCGGSTKSEMAPYSSGGSSSKGIGGSAPVSVSSGRCPGGCSDSDPRPSTLARPICSSLPPVLGNPCMQEQLACGYGDLSWCKDNYQCVAGVWGKESANFPCLGQADGYCPSVAPKEKSACVVGDFGGGVPCEYGSLLCICAAAFSAPGRDGTWRCYGPPEDKRCPASLPGLGEGCAIPGLSCDYALDGCTSAPHGNVFCFDGAWEDGRSYFCAE